jgi:hypothetical protein
MVRCSYRAFRAFESVAVAFRRVAAHSPASSRVSTLRSGITHRRFDLIS